MADRASIAAIVGPVAIGEFDNAKDHYKPELIEWATALPTLTDRDFLTECRVAIYNSALANRFRGNWDHDHFKATACFTEAKRRHVAAGHSPDCVGSTLYSMGHAKVMREHGYTPSPTSACNCQKAGEKTDGRT